MKSWLDLTKDEKQNLISEFREKYNSSNSNKLHEINKCLLIIIIPIALLVIMRLIVGTLKTAPLLVALLFILIIFYLFNIYKIKKENNDFSNWLKTKNIIK